MNSPRLEDHQKDFRSFEFTLTLKISHDRMQSALKMGA
jgi:hypothetical protein